MLLLFLFLLLLFLLLLFLLLLFLLFLLFLFLLFCCCRPICCCFCTFCCFLAIYFAIVLMGDNHLERSILLIPANVIVGYMTGIQVLYSGVLISLTLHG